MDAPCLTPVRTAFTSLLMLFILSLGLSAPAAAKVPPKPDIIAAAEKGKLKKVQKLIESGVDINDDWNGTNAIKLAIENDHREVVEYLVTHGANPDRSGGGRGTPVILALMRKDMDLMVWLLEHGASANAQTQDPRTTSYVYVDPTGYAAEENNLEALKLLLAHGARVDGNDSRELRAAAGNNNLEMVRLLVEKGAKVNGANDYGTTALHQAANRGNAELIQYLILKGANPNALEKYGTAPLQQLVKENRAGGSPEVLKRGEENLLNAVMVLVEAGADVNHEAEHVGPALYFLTNSDNTALGANYRLVGEYLISKGASLQAAASYGRKNAQFLEETTKAIAAQEAAAKEAVAARKREAEQARNNASQGNVSSGSCTCTRRSMRWVMGREQLRGHYEFYDEKVSCGC
ncbi:MAG: ankyrin repeat domain-containing protein [Fluviicoccus sp.]|uniref:ankyrin repeat domain-containing protein n=1 Tax=Fluviicoccus sp. TaxID=2003552 RepID=UPI00271CF4BC|nr:ankyrin repeat domain-containing protein [Fluviicoccus sp.]MDO8332105.1 ankyrin repeat domain-containing protein [Fluviicoccus sp.]